MDNFTRLSDGTWQALISRYPILTKITKEQVVAGKITFQNAVARAGELICFTTYPGTNTPLPMPAETLRNVKRWISEATWDERKWRTSGHPPDQFTDAESILQQWIRSGFQVYRWSQCYVINIILAAIMIRLGWTARLVRGNGTPSDTNGNGSIDIMSNARYSSDSVTIADSLRQKLVSDQANFRKYFTTSEDFIWNVHFWAEIDHNDETWIADATPTISLSENGTYVYGPCRRSSIHDRKPKLGDVSFARLSAIFNSSIKQWGEAGDMLYPMTFKSNKCNNIIIVGGTNVARFYRSSIDYETTVMHGNLYYFKVVNERLVEVVTDKTKFTRSFVNEIIYEVSFSVNGASVIPIKGMMYPLRCVN